MMRSAAALLALVLAACGSQDGPGVGNGGDTEVPERERFGGVAIVGAGNQVTDLNPLTSMDGTANQIQQFVLFMPLITYDDQFQPVPRWATSWEVNADTTELTFRLRDDVFWHDGMKASAHDVKFSYDRARDPETAFPNPGFWTFYGEAAVPDSFTFRVQVRPHADFLDPWRAFAPVPRHLLADVAPGRLRQHPFATRPVGNGPFKLVSHPESQDWVFEANPQFPAELGGRPYLDRLVYRAIPEPTTLLTELLTGGIDYYIAPTSEQAEQIKQSDRARLTAFPARDYVYIAWNARRPLFQDARVRRALGMAINREGIINGVLGGAATPASATIPPFFWQFDSGAGADVRYDPEAAKRLLQEAGYTDRNGDGIVEDAQGRPFRFVIKSNQGNRIRNDIAQIVQSDLGKIGVEAQPQVLEWNTLVEQVTTPSKRDFDAVVFGFGTEFQVDDSGLFHCGKRNEPYHLSGYCDAEMDRLLDTLPRIVDRAAARPLWARYQRKIAMDQPITLLYFQQRREGVSARLRNVEPDARGDLVGVDRWYIVPGQRRAAGPQQTAQR
ncbi:MAG: hypothetical protein H0V06_02910 [Gemmatimonadetes bacterium]|nr:hypothetical protein [Gemmatimonadota bacterium]